MQISHHSWHSPILGKEMPVQVTGHFGTPVLIFPTSGDDFREYERYGMLHALASHLEGGLVKFYHINSINSQSWFDDSLHPGEKARRHNLFDRYIVEEVVPFIYHDTRSPGIPIAAVGSSFGAYHAMNVLLRHPDIFKYNICMSGLFDVSRYYPNYNDDNCYFNNPQHYAAGLRNPHLSSCSINIICGHGPWEHPDWSQRMSDALQAGGIRHNMDFWGHDVSHDWPWWKVEMNHYLPKLFSRN